MAKALNKSRIQISRFIMIAVFGIAFFTKALIPYEAGMHEAIEFAGYLLIAVCALGRLYSTAFLGGHKNKNLITYGPFSVVRNPLYFFSLLGITGIALVSAHLLLIIFLPLAFVVIYHFLISREEAFLTETFGAEYEAYTKSTPRLIPNLTLYNAPDSIEVVPKYMNNAFRDAIWWFAAFPIFELAETLQESGALPTLFMVP